MKGQGIKLAFWGFERVICGEREVRVWCVRERRLVRVESVVERSRIGVVVVVVVGGGT